MIVLGLVLLCAWSGDSAVQNVTCPVVNTRELDLKELDGKWYLAGAATDLPLQGDCAMVVFNHKNDNTTDVCISWIKNNTASFYNGSVALTVDPNSSGDLLLITYTDQQTESYSFLDVDYEHYAVIFSCSDNDDGNSSTYELWKLSRSPHLKDQDAEKINKAIANYNLQDTLFVEFNATEDSCKGNGGSDIHSSVVMTSVATIALFRRFY